MGKDMTPEETKAFEEKIYAYVGRENGPPHRANDDVNTAMIRQWAEVMQEESPVYTDAEAAQKTSKGGIIAPPSMMYAWCMEGYPMADNPKQDMQRLLHLEFEANGYTGVLGTNNAMEMYRDLRPGDSVTSQMVIDTISEQKATARGIGYFIEFLTHFTDQNDEPVGKQVFRVLYFVPADGGAAAESGSSNDDKPAMPTRIASPRGHDNGWWWDAVDEGKMPIQRCKGCQTLRHPPRPMCGECQSVEWDSIESTLEGEIYSFTTLHYPKVPGYTYPLCCAVISLKEGIRIVSNIVGIDHSEVSIGMKVKGKVEQVDEKTMLPQFYPA
jgi:uncharacterized OB-fold protein